MTEDRELRREALAKLMELGRAAKVEAEAGNELAVIILELVYWIHDHCTD